MEVCLSSAGLEELGTGVPLAVHSRIALGVFAQDQPITIPASLEPFEVPSVGRCQLQYSSGTERYILSCKSAVRFPRDGWISIGPKDSGNLKISAFRYPWIPMNLLPGMSPVYKWVTLPMDNQIREALATGGQIKFRTETRIAVLERDVSLSGVQFWPAQ